MSAAVVVDAIEVVKHLRSYVNGRGDYTRPTDEQIPATTFSGDTNSVLGEGEGAPWSIFARSS
jgi:hypothetical protein